MAVDKKAEMQIDVCLAVEAGYWFGDTNLQRTGRAIKKLYQKLFSISGDQYSVKKAAQSIWFSIIDSPESPSGPLTLSAISQALLLCADFFDPEDQAAFLTFLKHNKLFSQLFCFFVLDDHSEAEDQTLDRKLNELFEQAIEKPVKSYDIFPPIKVKNGKLPLIPFRASSKLLDAIEIKSSVYKKMPDEVKRLKNIWMSLGVKGLREKFLQIMKKDEIFVFELMRAVKNKQGTVVQHLREKAGVLIGDFQRMGKDEGNQLFYLLYNDAAREKCRLSPGQVKMLLEKNTNRPGSEQSFNSRFEAIIARDDYLFNLVGHPEKEEEAVFQLHYPWLYARVKIDQVIKAQGNLIGYFKELSKSNPLTHQEAYLIARNPEYWVQFDPYALNAINSFFCWLFPSWYAEFFEDKKSKLAEISPVFKLRLEWQSGKHKHAMGFEEWLVQQNESGLDELIADIAECDSLTMRPTIAKNKTAFGESLLKNPCRFDAFLAEIDSAQKASMHEQFILDNAALEIITPDQVSRLMTSCPQLAEKIIIKKPQLIVDIISDIELRTKFSKKPDALIECVVTLISRDRSFLSGLLDRITVVIGQYSQNQLDTDLQKILIDNSPVETFTPEELKKINELSPAATETILTHEKFKDKLSAALRPESDRVEEQSLTLAKQLSGQRTVSIPKSLQFINGANVNGVASLVVSTYEETGLNYERKC